MKKKGAAKKDCISGTGIIAVPGANNAVIENQAEASQIYGKGYFGTPQSGGSLLLDALEIVFLAEMHRIQVVKGQVMHMEDVLRWGAKTEDGFEVKYLVYREMRQRGYVVKRASGGIDFRVFPRGGKPGSTPSKYWLAAVSERWEFSLGELLKMHSSALGAMKSLLVGVADEEGDITYYALSERSQFSTIPANPGPPEPAKAFLMEDRVMLFDMEAASIINASAWYGQLGRAFLLLSLLEAVYLQEKGWINVYDSKTGRGVSTETLKKRGKSCQEAFDLRLKAYGNMREKGLVVKTGFKYGAHFRVYDQDHKGHHARFLVHVMPCGQVMTWSDVSRAVRLAHGVKKELLFAVAMDDGSLEYVRIRRVTP